jgi:NAD(P)-dependent dehydrogenase (short-subunit alcohol dehydrogenase family)
MSKTWFVTGSSRGFGRRFAEAALSRGDKVAATARNSDALAGLAAAHGDAILPLPWTSRTRPPRLRQSTRPTSTSGAWTSSSTTSGSACSAWPRS